MGYFLRQTKEDLIKLIVVAALMRFQQKHTVEVPPRYEVNIKNQTVKIMAGEEEIYTFEELGFTETPDP